MAKYDYLKFFEPVTCQNDWSQLLSLENWKSYDVAIQIKSLQR